MGRLHPCPDGILRPGYVAPYYPYLFPRPYLAGIFVDYFQTLAKYLGCERVEFRQFPVDNAVCSPEECVNLLDGTIESGETFTYAVSTYLQYKDVYRYAYTSPAVMQEKIIFIEGRPADDIFTDTRLIFYTVYTYGALLAILLTIFLSIAVHYTRKSFARADKIGSRSLVDFLGSFLLVIGTSLLIIIWSAAYNGNNTVTTGPRELTIPQLLRQVQNGMRTMLLGNSTTFYEGDVELLFGNGNYTYLDNINERLEYICSNPEIVSMFYTPESYRFAQLSNINRKCRLQKIQPGPQHLPTAWLDKSVRTGDNFNFPLAKQATILLRRTIPKVEIALTNMMTPPIIDGRPFSLLQMELPLIFYFCGLVISFASLAVEIIYMPYLIRLLDDNSRANAIVSSTRTIHMSRNLSVCQGGFLELGYDSVSFPYLIQEKKNRLSGIFIDLFADAARLLHCEKGARYTEFPPNATTCDDITCFNYFDGKVENGMIFTSATSSFMNPPDVFRVSYTVPILMNMKDRYAYFSLNVVFLERVPAIALDTRLIFYTVFEYDALISIFITLLIIAIIDFLQSRLQKRYGNNSCFIERCNLPGAMTILFGLALLGFVYQAKYNGNNTIVKKETKTIQDAFSLIGAGRERFVFPDTSMFTDEEVQSITNNNPHVNINDDHDRLIYTCKHPSRTTLSAFYEAEVLHFSEMNEINRWCRLTSIPFDPRGGSLSVPWLDDSMVTGDDYQFVTSKQMPRKAVETLNFLILSAYNYDQQSSYLLRKYVSKLELAEKILKGDADFSVNESPFSMMQLEMPLMFLALVFDLSQSFMSASNTFNVCENGTLRLGFTQEAYPKLYYKEGRIVGYVEEFWRIILKEVGCDRLQFVNYDYLLYSCTTYECLTLLDGAVGRNEVSLCKLHFLEYRLHVFSNIPAMYFHHSDVFDYRYSMPIFWNELMLVEGQNSTDRIDDNPDLIQFTVFQYDALAMIILLLIAIKIIAYLFSELRKYQVQKLVFFDWMELLSACIALIGTTFAMAVYQSDFKGNAATVAVEAATSFSEMIKSMQSGARRMILEDAATFTPQERQALFGRSTTVMGDTARRIRAVCSDPKLVTMVYDQESLVMTTMDDLMGSCLLKRIASPRENENPVDWLSRSLKGAENTGFWTRRYLPVHYHYMIEDIFAPIPMTETYVQAAIRPVSFSRISIPFTIYFTIITISMIVFIIELTICPNGTLQLGYTAEAFPKTFLRNGRMVGYVAEFWRIDFGCERIQFIDYGYLSYSCHTDECLAMLDGAIERNEVFTAVPSTYFKGDEVFKYRYSLPTFSAKLLLVQGRNITDAAETDVPTLIQFTVFQPFAKMMLGIKTGEMRMILDENASFSSEEKTVLFGTTWTVQPDTATRIRAACADSSVVTFAYDQQSLMITNMNDINDYCTLMRVALPRADDSLYLSMTGMDVLQIGMPRETPFKVVERINEIAMKLFNWDLSNGFWLRRYIPARSHYLIDELVNTHNLPDTSFEAELRPLSLARLSIPFVIYLIALCVCILVFLAEILISAHCEKLRIGNFNRLME